MQKFKTFLNRAGIVFFSLLIIAMLASIAFGSNGLKEADTPQNFEKWYSDITLLQISVLNAIEADLAEAHDAKANIELALDEVNNKITLLEQSKKSSIAVLAQLKYTDVEKAPVNEEDKQRELDRLKQILNSDF